MPTTYRKEVLTTGEVARLCHVAPRTVSKWFDTGKLRGYRIPGSRDRRIPLGQLLAFMRVHGMPLDGLDGGLCRVIMLGFADGDHWATTLAAGGRLEVRCAANGFEAGVVAQQFRPHVVVLDIPENAQEEAFSICRNIKANGELAATAVVAAAPQQADRDGQWYLARGFDGCLTKPFTPAELFQAVQKATNFIT